MTMRHALACMVVGLGIVLAARADDHEGGDRRVHKLMERTHEGRRSPYRRLLRIAEGPGAPWPDIEQTVQGFEPMCRALLESPNDDIKGSADGYVDSVKAIAAAVTRRDEKAVREGIQSLKDSCGDCHFKGGVGGELDHDHGDEREVDERQKNEAEKDNRQEEWRKKEQEQARERRRERDDD